MAELDGLLLGAEVGITFGLAVQCVLALVAGVVAACGGRRWARVGLPLTLVLAVAAGGWTLSDCWQAQESVRRRMDGEMPGPHLPRERAENHLAWVELQGRRSVGIAAATLSGAALLRSVVGRNRRTHPAA